MSAPAAGLAAARTASAADGGAEDGGPPPTYWEMARSSPLRHRQFLLLILLQVLSVVTERVVLFALATTSDPANVREDAFFLVIILISAAFVFYFAFHSVLQANSFEMGAFFVASLLLLSRVAVEFANRDSNECSIPEVCLAFLALAVAFILAAMVFTVSIAKDLEWKRYKAIGAEMGTRKLYRTFELFSAVRKLDMQFSIITLVTGAAFFRPGALDSVGTYALGANLFMFVIEIAWEVLGDTAIKTEDEYRLYVFWALSLFLPVFIVSIAVDVLNGDETLLQGAGSASVRATIAAMAALALLNRAATVAVSVVLYRQFGPGYVGLRRIIDGDRRSKFNRHRVKGAGAAAAAGTAMVVAAPPPPAAVLLPPSAVAASNPFATATAAAAAAGEGVEDWVKGRQ